MKVTTALKNELALWLDTYWTTYLKGDIATWATFIRDDYRNIGGTKEEIWNCKQEIIDYTNSIMDQMIGTVDIRNREIDVIPYGEYMMVHEFTDLYVKIEGEWVLYGPFRMSSLLEKTDTGWIALHQHGSYPDMKSPRADEHPARMIIGDSIWQIKRAGFSLRTKNEHMIALEGEAFSLDAVKAENVKLLEAVKSKTFELEIEAALERVRSTSMAMHNSRDLSTVVYTVFTELIKLDAQLDRCLILMVEPQTLGITWYLTGKEGLLSNNGFLVPDNTHPSHQAYLEGWRTKRKKWHYLLAGEEKQRWDAFGFAETELAQLPDFIKADMAAVKAIHLSISSDDFGCLIASSLSPLSETHASIVERFTMVFNQTYTRFLDLQKAEAQAREAQIEASLERVRSSSLAMHRSEELQGVVNTVVEQLKELNIESDTTNILIFNGELENVELWTGSVSTGKQLNSSWHVSFTENTTLKDIRQAQQSGEEIYLKYLSFQEKNSFFEYLFIHTDFKKLNPERKKFILESKRATIIGALVKDIGIQIISYSREYFLPEEIEILKRSAKVFEQAYTRFLDLQKAEAQAREAQIEAALERVRSRSMAMHKSEEFPQVIQVVFEQFLLLDFKIDSAQFDVSFRETDDLNLWTAAPGQPYPTKLHIPYADYEVFNSIKKAKKAGHAFVSIKLTKEEKNDFFNYFFLHAPNIPEERKIFLLSSPGVVRSAVLLEKVSLAIQNYSAIPYSDAEHNILKRFAKVFEQTYTRFLDLQKAEAQAREAKIEAALERVRSKTMAMHKSEQLPETAQVLFEQFAVLGKTPDRMSIGVYNEMLGVSEWWVTDQAGIQIKHQFTAPLQEPTHAKMFSAWKEGKESIVIELEGDDLKEWVTFVRQVVKMPMDESQIKGRRVHQAAFFSQGQLLISSHEALPVESVKLLVRFAKVFSQTYTRFLDLQKAEAQAREAQIESALERVRSKAMAMRTSEDIAETTAASFDELKKLDIFSFRSGVGILTKGSTIAHVFADSRSIDGQVKPLTSIRNMEEHPALKRQYEAWEQQEDYEQILTGDELKSYYSHAFFQASTINVQEVEDGNQECGYYFAFPDGLFYSWSYQPYTESEKNILRRFRNIIALTFRRFLDLQKAEAQTREAQIEAALERIRSRALAMHRSEEFSDVAKVMREQMGFLGQPELETSAVHLYDEDADNIFSWRAFRLSSYLEGNIISGFFKIPKNSCAIASEFIQKFNSNATEYTIEVSGEKQTEWYKILFKLAPEVEEAMKISGTTNDIRYYHFAKFSGGAMLMVSSKEPANDAIELQKRSAQVFDLAYRRFKDLQKAETQALEAIKRASVDRVRAEIASMRTTSDLERIQPLIWNELKILGVPFLRCGVFIMDEEIQELQAFLSTPDGESIAAFHLPYHSTEQSKQIVGHWQQKQIFKDHMDEAAFAEYTKNLVNQGAVASDEKYVTENRPKDLYLHFLPFLQGMLYVGNDAQLKEDELELVQNLAETFSTAYARYEDFNKLEAAKNEVDMTLQELKQTQGQLIQAEKLASLGQLTAGIAHEIKNPLNFINNFSDVSIELIDEVLVEIQQSGDSDISTEIVEILNSVKSNLNIIHQHGARADGIVKSMLMHSRGSTGRKELNDLNAMIKENVNLAFHAMRATKHPINVETVLQLDDSVGEVPLIIEDFSRVILNLCNNAFDAMREKESWYKIQNTKYEGDTGNEMMKYKPKLIVRTKRISGKVFLEVEDNGIGITDDIRDKILQPFFTTKKGTQGTGLGLSITHDIIKAHGGTIEIETEPRIFSKFIITLI